MHLLVDDHNKSRHNMLIPLQVRLHILSSYVEKNVCVYSNSNGQNALENIRYRQKSNIMILMSNS